MKLAATHPASCHCGQLRVVAGSELLRTYQFNTMMAKHFFCPTCGIYTHHPRRSNPNEYSFDVGCLEDVDPFEVEVVTVHDGVTHPRDGAHGGAAICRRIRQKIR